MVLSVSTGHLVLLDIIKSKILSYEQLGGTDGFLHYWNNEERLLTLLLKSEDGSGVRAETYKASNLHEALNDLASAFELKKAIKMVIKYASLQREIDPISFLLN